MQEAIVRYAVAYGQLTRHQDRGAPMMARTDLDLMAEFGVRWTPWSRQRSSKFKLRVPVQQQTCWVLPGGGVFKRWC